MKLILRVAAVVTLSTIPFLAACGWVTPQRAVAEPAAPAAVQISATSAAPAVVGLSVKNTAEVAASPIPATATTLIAPTVDSQSADVLATVVKGPEVATADALLSSSDATAAALLPISPAELSQLVVASNIKHYTWSVIQVPDGASISVGQVIREGTDQNISLNLNELDQYFSVEGVYTLRLTLVDTTDQTSTEDFNLSIVAP
jgi:hypothetical protein